MKFLAEGKLVLRKCLVNELLNEVHPFCSECWALLQKQYMPLAHKMEVGKQSKKKTKIHIGET